VDELVFLIVLLFIIGVIVAVKVEGASHRKSKEEERKNKADERRRIEECGEVVLFYANNLGYIARKCISRDELEGLIDSGMSAYDLAFEIQQRINEKQGTILGYQPFGDFKLDVKLEEDFRDRHVYVIGKSGSGKTNLLRSMIYQDIEKERGIGIIAPEQEMITEEILPYIPEHRIDDVIYFNPADTDCPVSFNPVQMDEGEDIDLRVDENLTIFKRILGDIGPRMDEILRQSLYALLEKDGTTLMDMEHLLDPHNPSYRDEIIRMSRDPVTVRFFSDVYPQFPKDAHLPITTRFGKFLRPKTIRSMLCRPEGNLDFRKAMDTGKILLFNLSDGILGEANSQLLGQLIVSKFQMAVMSRANIPKEERRNFYLYIDEFQTFTGTAAASYEKILSRARKYKLGLVLAHQQTGQIPLELLKEILGNVSTVICFNVSASDTSRLAKEFITTINGEVIHIPQEEILKLKTGQAYCKIGNQSFFMETYLMPETSDQIKVERILETSRRNYGSPYQISLPHQTVETKEYKEQFKELDEIDPKKVF